MIITSLNAVNVLKYKKLELNDLPEKGIIAISGQNESGKSSIGETICYALFGRTWSLGDEERNKILLWGENQCSAKITFKTNEDKEYEIARFFDKDGTSGARISLVNDPKNPLARGNKAVNHYVRRILGYDATEFLETFYLAQREITTPNRNSFVVKTMAGITPLETASEHFNDQITESERNIAKFRHEQQEIDDELHQLNIQPLTLKRLIVQRQGAEKHENTGRHHLPLLTKGLNDYKKRLTDIKNLNGQKKSAYIIAYISLFFSAIFGYLWFMKATPLKADFLTPLYNFGHQVWSFLAINIPIMNRIKVDVFLYTAIILFIVWLIFIVRAAILKSNIRQQIMGANEFSNTLRDTLTITPQAEPFIPEKIIKTNDLADAEALDYEEVRDRDGRIISSADNSMKELTKNRCAYINTTEATAEEAEEITTQLSNWLSDRINAQNELVGKLDKAIGIEEERLKRQKRLLVLRKEFDANIASTEEEIETKKLSTTLLDKSVAHMAHRFNQNVREKAAKILPKFTENRYEHLQIEDDLTVRVFSVEKRDFMGLDEISSGTSRQIMLSLRLSLAQSLVDRLNSGKQFLFLDEPFAFFDAERTRLTLSMIPQLPGDLEQIWIISQEFADNHEELLAKHIICTRNTTEIT